MVEFSRRELKTPSDKLPALADVAERFSHTMPEDTMYLAGFWSPRSWLVEHLAWRVTKNAAGMRPPEWRAPTWSWLSIDGRISLVPKLDS